MRKNNTRKARAVENLIEICKPHITGQPCTETSILLLNRRQWTAKQELAFEHNFSGIEVQNPVSSVCEKAKFVKVWWGKSERAIRAATDAWEVH